MFNIQANVYDERAVSGYWRNNITKSQTDTNNIKYSVYSILTSYNANREIHVIFIHFAG